MGVDEQVLYDLQQVKYSPFVKYFYFVALGTKINGLQGNYPR